MDLYEILKNRRTVRRFKQDPIPLECLEKIVDTARFCPSAANLQPMRFRIVNDPETVAKMQPLVKWAAYLAPNGAPAEGEQPTAFVLVCVDKEIRPDGTSPDVGGAVQNILLASDYEGIGTCWMGSIDRSAIRQLTNLPERYELNTVIALGYKGEEPRTVPVKDGDIKYYKDANGVLNVPKRSLQEILI